MRDKVPDEQRYPKQQSTPLHIPSSPTHEFSFITQHHSLNTNATLQQPPPPAAIDLSPADDICSSNNSLDSFTLPINLLGNTSSFHCHNETTLLNSDKSDVATTNNKPNSNSFSIFGIPKWKKQCDDQIKDTNTCKKLKLDLGQLIKRYMKMVKPLLSFPKSKKSNTRSINHQSYSFSGNSLSRKPVEVNKSGKRRGQLSAPASMRTSPANSGILVASGSVSPTKIASESTMEELHAAIQAAIAHCKNSVAMEDKFQSQKL